MNTHPRRDFDHEARIRHARAQAGLPIDYPRPVFQWQKDAGYYAGSGR
jgi:hypothetical protein